MKWMAWTLWALLVSGAFVGDARAQSADDFLETGWILVDDEHHRQDL